MINSFLKNQFHEVRPVACLQTIIEQVIYFSLGCFFLNISLIIPAYSCLIQLPLRCVQLIIYAHVPWPRDERAALPGSHFLPVAVSCGPPYLTVDTTRSPCVAGGRVACPVWNLSGMSVWFWVFSPYSVSFRLINQLITNLQQSETDCF